MNMTKTEKEMLKDLERCIAVRDEMIEQARKLRDSGNELMFTDKEKGVQCLMMATLLDHYINKMF